MGRSSVVSLGRWIRGHWASLCFFDILAVPGSAAARTDIWALGVVLYELVSGHLPFQAPTMPQLCGLILSDPPPPIRQWRTDVPPRFEALIMRCLAKDPRQRFFDVAELALALADFSPPGSTQSIERILKLARSSSGGIPRPVADGPRSEQLPHSWGNTAHRTGSRGLFGIAVVAALALAGGTWFVLHRTASSRSPESLPLAQPAEPSARPTAEPAPPPAPTAIEPQAPAPSATIAVASATVAVASATVAVASAPSASHSAPPRSVKPPPKHGTAASATVAPPPPPPPPSPAPPGHPLPNPLDGRM